VTPQVSFPIGLEATMGGFTKDLKNSVAWPGRIQAGIDDTNRPSFDSPVSENLLSVARLIYIHICKQ
jgi:hypothetical protein